jgi:hypothetical protein
MIRTPVRQSAAVVLLMQMLFFLAGFNLPGGAALAQSQPPQGPPQTFIVYFHSGSTKLTPIDLQTVARAARQPLPQGRGRLPGRGMHRSPRAMTPLARYRALGHSAGWGSAPARGRTGLYS